MMNNQGHVFQQVGYDAYGNITYSGVPSGIQVEEHAGSYVPVYSDVLTFPGARGSALEMRDFTSDDLAMLIGPAETIGVQTNADDSITVTIPTDAILFDNTDGHWGIDIGGNPSGPPVTITDDTHSFTIDTDHNNLEMRALAGGGFKVREAGDGVSAKELSDRGWINSDGDLKLKLAVVGDDSTFVKAKPTVFSSLPVRFAFDGMEWKPDEAMYDAWHRMYDPESGTFTSQDPADADPVNESRFVGNDPLNLTDTSGLMAGSYVNPFNTTPMTIFGGAASNLDGMSWESPISYSPAMIGYQSDLATASFAELNPFDPMHRGVNVAAAWAADRQPNMVDYVSDMVAEGKMDSTQLGGALTYESDRQYAEMSLKSEFNGFVGANVFSTNQFYDQTAVKNITAGGAAIRNELAMQAATRLANS